MSVRGPRARAWKRSAGLATRLLVALVLVVIAGSVTAWLVAMAVAPALFSEHMRRAGPAVSAQATLHAEEAFRSASAISLSVALLAALAASVAVSVFLARRLGRSIAPLSHAASEVAAGRYGVRVASPGLGAEFDEVADAFNQMAGRLERVDESRRRLLADLAHELRTPVATLAAYLEGLEDGVATLDADTTAVLRAQTTRLERLAADIAAVSAAEAHEFSLHARPVAPSDLVAAAVGAAAERYAGAGVALGGSVATGLPAVLVDPDRLAQVLGNLLDNALRHTPSGGSVLLGASSLDAARVRISVTDSGEGIAAEHLPRVFERFYRVDAARDRGHGGSGIGLAIVKALVEAHGGRVGVTSAGPGQGATFTVDLPTAGDGRSQDVRPGR